MSLDSLKPLDPQDPSHFSNTHKKKRKEGERKGPPTVKNKYQTFIYNILTKIRQVYKIKMRVEILDD